MPHVALTIVTWNSMKYLPEALASIEGQAFRDFTLIIVDNASTDGTAEFVKSEYPRATFIRNTKNLGFCHAHNQAIAYASAQLQRDGQELFVLVTNPDVVLEPSFLERLVGAVERRPEIGSACGKLLKMVARGDGELIEGQRTNLLDSAGLKVFKSRRIVDRGAGESDGAGRYDETEEVFGPTGALALYRLAALNDVAANGAVFDEDFFVYKEDIDLAWRLRLAGWGSLYVPAARAYHYRTAAGSEKASALAVIRGRRSRSKAVNFYSYRNHLLLVLKNDHVLNWLLDSPRIVWYELRKFLYVLFAEPTTLRGLFSYWALVPKMLGKRGAIMRGAKVRARDVRKWFA